MLRNRNKKEDLKLISTASRYVGKSKFKETYKNPIPEKVKLMERLFDLLHEETKLGTTTSSVEFIKLCTEFKIRKTKITDEILFFEGPPLETPVAFFWRVGAIKQPGKPETYSNPVDPLILESPHEGKDNTARTSTRVFEQTRAKILLMNTVHPKIGKKGIRCKKNSYNSDGSHCDETLFHKVHVKLYNMFPYSFFVQIHGWANTKFLMMCMNAHNNIFTRKCKSGPLLFARAGLTTYTERTRKMIFMGDKALQVHGYKRPGGFHNTCVQARHLYGGSQCKRGDSDKGNFMHIELGQKLIKKSRYYNHNVKKFCETLNLAIEDWVSLDDELKKLEYTEEQRLEPIVEESESELLEELVEDGFYNDDCGEDCDSTISIPIDETHGKEIEDPDDMTVHESEHGCCLPLKP